MPFGKLRNRLFPVIADGEAVQREKLRLLSNNASGAILGNLVLGLVLVATFASTPIILPFAIAWYLGVIATGVARLLVVRRYRTNSESETLDGWLDRIAVVSAFMGLMWGLSAFTLFADLSVYQTMIGIMLVCGVCASSAVLNGVHRPAMVGFIACALLPTTVVFAFQGQVLTYVMALACLFFFVIVVRGGMAIETSIRNAVQLAEKNEKLVSNFQTNNQILRESREEMRIIADFSYAWESWHDPDARLLWVNRACERVTGYTPTECLQMPDYPLRIVHPDDRDLVARGLAAATSVVSTRDIEFRITRKDGEVRWCAAASQPVMDTAGNVRGFRASARDITDRKALEERLNHLAETDVLTGVFNRRKFLELMPREMYRAERYGVPLSIALFDLDHFKKVNDTYGHGAGDECLKAFADLVQGVVRKSDVLARIGGEEFVLMLPETPAAEAVALTDRLRKMTAEMTFNFDKDQVTVTTSAGVATASAGDKCVEDLMDRADQALYEAKEGGRNKVVLAKPATQELSVAAE